MAVPVLYAAGLAAGTLARTALPLLTRAFSAVAAPGIKGVVAKAALSLALTKAFTSSSEPEKPSGPGLMNRASDAAIGTAMGYGLGQILPGEMGGTLAMIGGALGATGTFNANADGDNGMGRMAGAAIGMIAAYMGLRMMGADPSSMSGMAMIAAAGWMGAKMGASLTEKSDGPAAEGTAPQAAQPQQKPAFGLFG